MLEIKNLKRLYAANQGLNQVSLKINPSEVVALLGANGAGKSTLFKILLGWETPEAGEIVWFGSQTMHSQRKAILDRTGFIASESWLEQSMTLKDHLNLAGSSYTYYDQNLVDELLARFKLDLNRKVLTFSRGEKIRAQFVIAFSHHPQLLLLDEATSGLDAAARQDVLSLLSEHSGNENHGILLATHHSDEVLRLASRVVFLRKSKILLDLPLNDLLNRVLVCEEKLSSDTHTLLGIGMQNHYYYLLPSDQEAKNKATLDEILAVLCKENTGDAHE
ncbi:MAG: ABC transporter ATP-binding protein [Candidatus Cloacimonetes bacterium]|nr:ABC transporter ATP-binding protein [Candidatus Cloacimonadota bacterium]